MFNIGDINEIKKNSKAQLHQDYFVLCATNNRENGYYVEFGATDGVSLSNTWVLENMYGWKGILAEPAHCYQKDLLANRGKNNHIETACIWKNTGDTFSFNEVGVLSTIHSFSDKDAHSEIRMKNKNIYDVTTLSLVDMLDKYNAPKHIDYLSIDTEGSEFDILSAFDWDKYKIDVITCEHNFTAYRQKIYDLLIDKGYERVLPELSKFDDWYILKK